MINIFSLIPAIGRDSKREKSNNPHELAKRPLLIFFVEHLLSWKLAIYLELYQCDCSLTVFTSMRYQIDQKISTMKLLIYSPSGDN